MTPKQQINLVFFRQINDLGDQKTTPQIEVLLSELGAFQYQDASPRSQKFFRGQQVFPVVKEGRNNLDPWPNAMIELRDQAGQRLYDWVKNIINQDQSRLIEIGERSFAVEVCQNDFNSGIDFLDLIDLSPQYTSIGWHKLEDILDFEDLDLYKESRLPRNIKAIFNSDKKVLTDLIETIKEE